MISDVLLQRWVIVSSWLVCLMVIIHDQVLILVIILIIIKFIGFIIFIKARGNWPNNSLLQVVYASMAFQASSQ